MSTKVQNILFTLYSVLFAVLGSVEYACGEVFATIRAIKITKIDFDEIFGFELGTYRHCSCKGNDPDCKLCLEDGKPSGYIGGLNSHGMCVAPDPETGELGTQVSLIPTKLKIAKPAGLYGFLMNSKEIPCLCQGTKDDCPWCIEGKRGTALDRAVVRIPPGHEKKTFIAILLDKIRNDIKAGKYNRLAIVLKGDMVILATVSALREIDANPEARKLIKKVQYQAGNYLYENVSAAKALRLVVFKDEADCNGQIHWAVKMVIHDGKDIVLGACGIRKRNNSIFKGSAATKSIEEIQWHLKRKGIAVDGIVGYCTDEVLKGLIDFEVIEDHDTYRVLEVNTTDFLFVSPPLRPGFPSLGLTLWKYGMEGLELFRLIVGNQMTWKVLKIFRRALAGEYEAETEVLSVKMPLPGDESQIPGLCFSIPAVNEHSVEWKTPKDEASWDAIWKRFLSFFENKILQSEYEGTKELVASCSWMVDAYEKAYREQHPNGPETAFAIFPDEKIYTWNGKKHIIDFLLNKDYGFICGKNPLSSIRQLVALVPLGERSLREFLLTGVVTIYGDDNPVLGYARTLTVSSDTMQRRMCIMDFDGDKMFIILIRNGWERIRQVLTSTPCEWEKEFAEAIPEDNQVLATEQDILEYYSNLMIAVFAARQAIGPMVKSALRTYALRIYQAVKNGNIGRWTLEKSNELQKTLSAVSEILAIKMEKSFASVKNTFTGWLWVDMSKEFAKKASDFVGVLNNVSKGDMRVVSTLMNYIAPKGKVSVYNEADDEWLQEDSSHPFDVLRTFVSEVKTKFQIVEPLMKWFPYLYFVKAFKCVEVQKKVYQGVVPKRGDVEPEYHMLRSDVQKQHMIFKRILDAFMSSNNILIGSELFIKFDNAATAFVRDVRLNLKEIAIMFDGDDPNSLEKKAYTHHVFTGIMQIIIDLGIAEPNESHPWNAGQGKNADMEFFFALLVATKDFAYQRREDGDGYRFVDGKKSSFNRVTRTGIEMCVKGYYEVIANSPLSFFNGGEDHTLLKDIPGFSLPYWVLKGNNDPYFTSYDAPGVDDSAV